MRHVPNVPGAILNADAFMAPNELVGFFIAEQPRSVALHLHDFFELALVTSPLIVDESADEIDSPDE